MTTNGKYMVLWHFAAIKVYLYPKNIFDMWKGHILEVHYTNIQLKIFIK